MNNKYNCKLRAIAKGMQKFKEFRLFRSVSLSE